MNSFRMFSFRYCRKAFNFSADNEYMNCFVNFLSSTSLILWFHDLYLNSASWSLSCSNRIWYFLYSLKIETITEFLEWSFWISRLHNICASSISFWYTNRISLLVMTNIFTFCDDCNIECNLVISCFINAIVSSTQFIIEFVDRSHDILRTISLSDCFVTSRLNLSQCRSILK